MAAGGAWVGTRDVTFSLERKSAFYSMDSQGDAPFLLGILYSS